MLTLIHWEVKVGGTSMKDVGSAVLAGSAPQLLGRERAARESDDEKEERKVGFIENTAMRHRRGG